MKKSLPILLLLFVITLWASWQFAFATPKEMLVIAEVPAEKSPTFRSLRFVKMIEGLMA
jgi:hypothetical protein